MSRLNPNLQESGRPHKKAKIADTRPNPTRFNFVDQRQVSKQINPAPTPMEIDTKEEQQENSTMPRGLHV